MSDLGGLMARTRTDDRLRRDLLQHPRETLAAHGIEIPADVPVRVVESTDRVLYLALPPRHVQDADDLSEEHLSGVAGGIQTGSCWFDTCSCSCCDGV